MADLTIVHEDLVRAVVVDEGVENFASKTDESIAAPGAIGGTFSQAEVAALRTAIIAIVDALVLSGVVVEDA